MMRRGDIVLSVLPGDYGKPRPTVIVQNNDYNDSHDSIVVCPLTPYPTEGLPYRLRIQPSENNGLSNLSEIMTDKISVIRRDKLRQVLGCLTAEELHNLDNALEYWLSLI